MKIYSVKEFGTVADGITLCSEAVQKTVDYCHANGGGIAGVFAVERQHLQRLTDHLQAFTSDGQQIAELSLDPGNRGRTGARQFDLFVGVGTELFSKV